jgi:hypothetical protein
MQQGLGSLRGRVWLLGFISRICEARLTARASEEGSGQGMTVAG